MINIKFYGKYYKKTISGYHKEENEDDSTHVIYTIKDHEAHIQEVVDYIYKLKKSIMDLQCGLENTNKSFHKAEDSYEKRIKSILSELNDANSEINRLNNLNKGLKDICRRRANSNRDINDKKRHFGYLYMGGKQLTFKCKSKTSFLDLEAWAIKIQTPYDYTLKWDYIAKEIEKDLSFFTQNMGLEKDYSHKLFEMDNDDINKLWSSEKKNFYFKIMPIANDRTGLWEIEFYTRYDIEVPEYMVNPKFIK